MSTERIPPAALGRAVRNWRAKHAAVEQQLATHKAALDYAARRLGTIPDALIAASQGTGTEIAVSRQAALDEAEHAACGDLMTAAMALARLPIETDPKEREQSQRVFALALRNAVSVETARLSPAERARVEDTVRERIMLVVGAMREQSVVLAQQIAGPVLAVTPATSAARPTLPQPAPNLPPIPGSPSPR